jgi:type IV secretory pathway VirB2 component (pilin)
MLYRFLIKFYCKKELLKQELINDYGNLSLLLIGVMFLTFGLVNLSIADGVGEATIIIQKQLCNILKLLEGAFGALVMVVAGLAAVVTAAMGAYKMAMSCVVIACGSHLVQAFMILFFDDQKCGSTGGDIKDAGDNPGNTL